MIILIVSNKGVKNVMKIVKSLAESGLLVGGVSEAIGNESKDQTFEIQKYKKNVNLMVFIPQLIYLK